MNSNPNRQVIIGIAVIAGICLLLCVCCGITAIFAAPFLYEWASSQGGSSLTPLEVGSAAPEFELAALNGETIRLSQFQGKPVLLSFGATWCPPCREEIPLVQTAHENHPELIVLLVDINEKADVVRPFVIEMGITHLVLLDENRQVSRAYRISGIPTSYFIDVDGTIRASNVGLMSASDLSEKLLMIGIKP